MALVSARSLLAVSDLHVSHERNREVVDRIRPTSDGDWLIVAGDVAETVADIEATLRLLRDRFARVIWVPGNHELWTTRQDPVQLRGEARYHHLVEVCRGLGVLTPEDPYPVWETDESSYVVAPLFLLYDYSFRDPNTSLDAAMKHAYETGVVCTDEFMLHPDPYPTRADWCRQRIEVTEPRLAAIPQHQRTILVSHWPLHQGPTRMLRFPQFAMWCGSTRTADWHVRFRAEVAVSGHLHIPLTLFYDGVRFEEVSLGYPREWQRRGSGLPDPVRRILPVDQNRQPAGQFAAIRA
ncbi:3',5'-cyclic AMP phosphodiesterase CpdA [Goodfellowiella coeruleoviolacea]|uniref:3',5'-cyclic AMP phosphodiesterase CpdA n=1 Tax=Goodfellowiella coeruleoviolacea TaxID=334858 RepID=A0AAE3GJE0_9PSEU|nr:3',5'-cyclic AMP phosphodiesterase CpdA [Goodfellowiella coeruleoviolacea]